jgi:hypothetical protein
MFLTPFPHWGSAVMRGQLTAAAINHAWGKPLGVRASFCGPDTCDRAIKAHGRPSVCVVVKFSGPSTSKSAGGWARLCCGT